jgi:hypothetical protein
MEKPTAGEIENFSVNSSHETRPEPKNKLQAVMDT